jgi:predicted xylose isomerase-like sugar epimerase
MNELIRSCGEAADYPKNLVSQNTYQHVLDSYFHQLQEKEDNLFCSPKKAAVHFWQFDREAQGTSF